MMLSRRLLEVQGHLYRNNGDGTFEDIFADLGLDLFGWVKGVAVGDVDRDGLVGPSPKGLGFASVI